MWRRKWRRGGDTAVVDGPPGVNGHFSGTEEELFAEIAELSEANRSDADRDTERRLLRLRHLAGIRMLNAEDNEPRHPDPDYDALAGADRLPDIAAERLTPGLLRAGILRDGCLLVRGLISREDALAFAAQIDRSFAERQGLDEGKPPADGYYEPFRPEASYEMTDEERHWIRAGGGVLAADSPLLSSEMIELFRSAGLPQLVEGYLGERPVISVQKTTLRKAEPTVAGAWHQDGKFMGEVRSLNLWLSLSRCGDEAPGLDLVPRRLDGLVATQTDEAMLDIQVSRAKAEEAAGDAGIVRPIFEPGDALFFDELFLHSTGSDPSMPKPRFAIENWFFGGSSFPSEYGPLAI